MRVTRRVSGKSRRARSGVGAFVVGMVGLSVGVALLIGTAYIGIYFHALPVP